MKVLWPDGAQRAVGQLLARANGRRTARTLALSDVEAVVAKAAEDERAFAWSHGGSVNDVRALTTLCLAVRRDDAVVLTVGAVRAAQPSPAALSPRLSEWDTWVDANNRARAMAWAANTTEDQVVLALQRPAPVSDERALHAAVLADPHSVDVRLVYADALTERGDDRGEFISLQCQPQASDDALDREEKLLARHGASWMWGVDPDAVRVSFVHGFIEAVTVLDAAALTSLRALFEHEPVTRLRFEGARGLDIGALGAAPWLRRVEVLELVAHRTPWAPRGSEIVPALIDGLMPGRLRGLVFDGCGLGDVGALMLAAGGERALRSLRQLVISHDAVSNIGLQAFASTSWFAALHLADFTDNELRAEGAAALAFGRGRGALQTLVLDGNHLGNDGARALAIAPRLTSLRHLSLRRNRIGASGAEALLRAPSLRALESLSLEGNPIGGRNKQRLAARFPHSGDRASVLP